MNDHGADPATGSVFNVPNQLTAARLALALVLFGFLSGRYYATSLVLFLIAAGTDWLDGYWARKYGQVTVLGRILDPFADKIIVCGSFVFLAAEPESLVTAWMAVVVLGRELLVTALRSFLEERGHDFSASRAGKWKMVVQCAAVAVCLYRLSYQPTVAGAAPWVSPPPLWLGWTVLAAAWFAVALTVYSGVGYVVAAIGLMRK
ncbi:MAG: hypothetical protein BMS9Abin04_196 [Planctomycetia bacterium]|nr:MAG: hypothetical protein BMS9Abin04_196 [Planctomycetia bacterium]